jgi:hypothetical protein
MASSGPGAPGTLPLRPAISKGGEGEDAMSPRMGPKAGKGMLFAFLCTERDSSLR